MNLQPLKYNGVTVEAHGDGMYCLTDMWKAVGSPANKSPYEWSRFGGAEFIASTAAALNTGKSRIYKPGRGKHGKTFAHWQIALAYAKYLSHDFHRYVNEIFARFESADTSIAKSVIDRQTDPEKLDYLRTVIDRKSSSIKLSKALARYSRGGGEVYRVVHDGNNKVVTGMTAKQIQDRYGVKQTRDALTPTQNALMTILQDTEVKRMDSIQPVDTDGVVRAVAPVQREMAAMMERLDQLGAGQ
jgi:hypothetical protein